MATLETRIISGKGLLKIPASDDLNKAKRITLFCDVIRLPFNGYYNTAYNPPKGRYATINLFKGDYLVQELIVEYPARQWDFYPDPAAQTLYAVKCSYAGILQTFFNLGNALSLPSISVTNNIEDWFHTDYWWDTAKVVCYSDSALRLVVESEPFLLCPDDEEASKQPPPPPPEPPTDVPPGTTLGEGNYPVSDPYEGADDNGDTQPYPGDEYYVPPPEFPQGTRCTPYSVSVTASKNGGGTDTDTSPFFGEIVYIGINPSNSTEVIVISHGLTFTSCSTPEVTTVVFGFSGGYVAGSVTYTITPI